jgi:hypothetical protein
MTDTPPLPAHPGDDDQPASLNLASLGPGLIRLAAASWWRVATWSVQTSVAVVADSVRSVATGQAPFWATEEGITQMRQVARRALGLPQLEVAARPDTNGHTGLSAAQLRARGAALLFESARVDRDDDVHPAYARILDELAPDEARILRFVATEGSQAAVDVRTSRPLGIGSELVASGLTMIGLQSGVKRVERTKPYLNNLYRLGLVWFSHEPLPNPARYQVLEVQPDVAAALKQAGRMGKTVRRSIELTPFGTDFCQLCLPLDMNGVVALPLDGNPEVVE